MVDAPRDRRLAFVKTVDFGLWRCRPIGTIDVLDLRDRRIGHVDGIVIDVPADRPLFLAIAGQGRSGPRRFVVPVGDAWFDQTERALRVDVNRRREPPPFNPDEFARMSPVEAEQYERRVLGHCCPEVGLDRDGAPDYERLSRFQCPTWLRTSPTHT
jgi:hypothetical protein